MLRAAMRTLITALVLTASAALPAFGQSAPVSAANVPFYVGQVPLLPLPDGDHPDIEALVAKHWRAYWRASGDLGFGPQHLRAGRFDLDRDGRPELFVLIDSPGWQADIGKPLVMAAWTKKGWMPIGWSWADEDGIFVTPERIDEWYSVDTGKHLMRWTAKGYAQVEKPDGQ